MGQSTDGILCFGIPFDEGEFPYEEMEGFPGGGEERDQSPDGWLKNIINAEAGIIQPEKPWSEQNKEEYHKLWDLERKAEEAFPIALTTHCSGDYPMYVLIIRGTEIVANRGETIEVDPHRMIVSPEQIEVLKNFCDKYKIEWQQPKWYLCSYWG